MKLKSYLIGFILSLALTLAAYVVVQIHVASEHSIISHAVLIPTIFALAFVQLAVQPFYFLHLSFTAGAGRWKAAMFVSTFALVLLVVVGSLWIMNHLNYNMTPARVNQYMQDQQGGF